MGMRANLFLRPTSEVLDFVFVELRRAAELLQGMNEPEVLRAQELIEKSVALVAPRVDPKVIAGKRRVYERAPKLPKTQAERLCAAWNLLRSTVLWSVSKVSAGYIPGDFLRFVLLANNLTAVTIRQSPTRDSDGCERFSVLSTVEIPSMDVIKAIQAGYTLQYCQEKRIAPGQVPLSVLSKSWSVPTCGWSRDLAEECGRILADIDCADRLFAFDPSRNSRSPRFTSGLLRDAKSICNPVTIVNRARNKVTVCQ